MVREMFAARWHGRKDIRVEKVAEPGKPGPKQVKLKVVYAGICGTDLHEYLSGPIFIPTKPHPISGHAAPLIMGHEFCGIVEEIGEGVDNVQVGDHVAVEPILSCGKCRACRVGSYNLCEYVNFQGLCTDGGFAPYNIVPDYMCHKLPAGMPMEQGALVEPAAVGLYAVRASIFKPGDTAAVFGAGPIGQMVLESLVIAGATKIFVAELSAERRAAAKVFAPEIIETIDPAATDPVSYIKGKSAGGVNCSFEVTGDAAALPQSIDATYAGGETIIVSIWENKASFQPNSVVIPEKTVKGVIAYRNIFPEVIKLMSQGYFPAAKIVSKKIALQDIVTDGFEALTKDKRQIKVLVDMAE